MARDWHIIRTDQQLTLCRQLPPRFDVVGETTLPLVRKGRLAQQIRQDLWRALQNLRGFSPVVEVTETTQGLRIRAGGRIDAAPFPKQKLEAQIDRLLASVPHRDRWLKNARIKEVS